MKTENIKQALELFTTDDDMRPFFQTPFKQGGKYFATDAHSLICIDAEGIELPYGVREKPNCLAVIPTETNRNVNISIADLKKQLKTKKVPKTIQCPECNGSGEMHCDCCDNDYDCRTCDSAGSILDPDGGTMENPATIFLMDNIHYKYPVLKKLVDACELLEIPSITMVYGTNTNSTKFIHENLIILSMPCTDSEHEVKITL